MRKFSSLCRSVQELCWGQNLVSSIHRYIHTYIHILLLEGIARLWLLAKEKANEWERQKVDDKLDDFQHVELKIFGVHDPDSVIGYAKHLLHAFNAFRYLDAKIYGVRHLDSCHRLR